MAYTSLSSYPRRIIKAVRDTLAYFQANVTTPDQAAGLSSVVFQTLENALDNLRVWDFANGTAQAYEDLATIFALPLTLPAGTSVIAQDRLQALQVSANSLATGYFKPKNVAISLSQGQPAIPIANLTAWMSAYLYETLATAPTIATLASTAQAQADAWAAIASALSIQAPMSGAALNAATLMASCSQAVSDEIATMTLSASGDPITLWNVLAYVPVISAYSRAVRSDPTDAASQELQAARYAILQAQKAVQIFIAQIAEARNTSAVVKTAKVRRNDTLRDIAARELGDHELWYAIAQVNGLQPPFIATTPGVGTVMPGARIFLPGSQTTGQMNPSSYENNFLGTDLNFGSLYGDMPTWTGDFVTISGYANLRISLGRRILTPLGSLIYHSTYGSRIPLELGKILQDNTSGHLSAYATYALLSDPRISDVKSITVTLSNNQFSCINAEVIPAAQTSYSDVNLDGNPVGTQETVTLTAPALGQNSPTSSVLT